MKSGEDLEKWLASLPREEQRALKEEFTRATPLALAAARETLRREVAAARETPSGEVPGLYLGPEPEGSESGTFKLDRAVLAITQPVVLEPSEYAHAIGRLAAMTPDAQVAFVDQCVRYMKGAGRADADIVRWAVTVGAELGRRGASIPDPGPNSRYGGALRAMRLGASIAAEADGAGAPPADGEVPLVRALGETESALRRLADAGVDVSALNRLHLALLAWALGRAARR